MSTPFFHPFAVRFRSETSRTEMLIVDWPRVCICPCARSTETVQTPGVRPPTLAGCVHGLFRHALLLIGDPGGGAEAMTGPLFEKC
jgi:hypothetical protein